MIRVVNVFFIIITTWYIKTTNNIDLGYPTVIRIGFYHNALYCTDGLHSSEKSAL